jgi:hypothetical protein
VEEELELELELELDPDLLEIMTADQFDQLIESVLEEMGEY